MESQVLILCVVYIYVHFTSQTAGLNQTGRGQGEECRQTSECVLNAQCWVNLCQCNIRFYPHQGQCELRHGPGWLCTSSMQCVDSAICYQNYCQCNEAYYHTGNTCSRLLRLSPLNIRVLQTNTRDMTITWDPPQLIPKWSTPHYSITWNSTSRPERTSRNVMTMIDLIPGSLYNVIISTIIDENKTIKMSPQKMANLRTTPSKPFNLRHSSSSSSVSIYWSVEGQVDSFNGSLCSRASCDPFTTPYNVHMFLLSNTSSPFIFYISARSGHLVSQTSSFTFWLHHPGADKSPSPSEEQRPSSLLLTAFVSSTITAIVCAAGICFWKTGYCPNRLHKRLCCKNEHVYEDLYNRSRIEGGSIERRRGLYENQQLPHGNTGHIVFENDMSNETIDLS